MSQAVESKVNSEVNDAGQDSNSYDLFPYPSHPFPQTHPERLASVAKLFEVEAPAPETARVLEIGSASGGNLIPMASQLPGATFLGIDLSQRQIEEGQQRIERLDLANIELRHANLLDARSSLGEFDYVICHGVYSWVPADVQTAILEVCRDHLSPNGVAFVSYNTYPGWHFRGLVRDMMCYHDNSQRSPQERVVQARALLGFLAESVSAESSAYGMMLRGEFELLSKHDDRYLFHEHLEANNHPCYFHEFMAKATAAQLQYLGDSSVSSMWIGNFPEKVATTLQRIAPDIIQREQYTDFVRNRLFRQTLLCHANARIDRGLGPRRIQGGLFAGRFTTDNEQANVDLAATTNVTFQSPGNSRQLTTRDPLIKAAVVHISNAWPASIGFDELFQAARLSLGANQIEDASRVEAARDNLATQLLRLYVSGMLELKFAPDRFTTQIAAKPATTAIVREQAARENRVTNQRHESVHTDDFVRHLCPALDGSRDRGSLMAYVKNLVEQGKLVIHRPEGSADQELEALLSRAVEQALQKMAKQALLV